eukprot:TRINITY_DN102717_c0_g1_i1.p1 TRINITY_DN102717_c0_g1~~TRINITY_DN102717_c0_g1_i1.p1  ORF type:complete len:418 (-),score=72.99 TRINITY_DN102717_c0_g1_i1:463-1716(-)
MRFYVYYDVSCALIALLAVGMEAWTRSEYMSAQWWTPDDAFHHGKHFVCYLFAILALGRIMVVVTYRFGGVFAAAIFAPVAKMSVNGPRLRGIATKLIVDRGMRPGGTFGVDDQLFDTFLKELEGWYCVVWLSSATVLAARKVELPLGPFFVLFEKPILLLASWRLFSLIGNILDVISHCCMVAASIPIDNTTVRFCFRLVKLFLTSMVGCCFMSWFGYDVSATLGGIGLTGLFLGLASQAVLQDMFSWAIILAQKPFSKNDFVCLCKGAIGKVEHIDYFQTWVRTLAGERLVFSNKQVLGDCITNYSVIDVRGMNSAIEVSARTPPTLLAEIPELAKAAVEAHECCKFGLCWLKQATEWGYSFELLFEVTDPDYNLARNTQTSIWITLLKSFEEKGIVMASADRLDCMAGVDKPSK